MKQNGDNEEVVPGRIRRKYADAEESLSTVDPACLSKESTGSTQKTRASGLSPNPYRERNRGSSSRVGSVLRRSSAPLTMSSLPPRWLRATTKTDTRSHGVRSQNRAKGPKEVQRCGSIRSSSFRVCVCIGTCVCACRAVERWKEMTSECPLCPCAQRVQVAIS